MSEYSHVQAGSKLVTLADGIVEGNEWPLVPDGEYVMQCLWYETVLAFRTPKVILHMQIVEPGQHYGKILLRAYRVKELIGKRGKHGRFRVTRHQELFLALVRLHNRSLRYKQISLRALTKVVLRVTTRTVVTDYCGRPLPTSLHYSVVDQLVAVEAGTL